MHGSISITNVWLRGMSKKKEEDNLDFERTKTDSYIHEWRILFTYLHFFFLSNISIESCVKFNLVKDMESY